MVEKTVHKAKENVKLFYNFIKSKLSLKVQRVKREDSEGRVVERDRHI